MGGLYKRAQELIRHDNLLSLIRHEKSASKAELDISDDESEEILSNIDKVASNNTIAAAEKKLSSYKPKKRSIVLPLLVNLAAVAVIAAGVLIFSYYFRQRENSIVSERADIASTESRLIQRLKEESEVQLSQKEMEIEDTKQRLNEIAKERDTLQTEMDTKIQTREAELRSDLERELNAEREKLLSEGRTTEDIQSILDELALEKEAAFNRELASYQEQMAQELEAKTESLARLTEEYQSNLEQRQLEERQLRESYDAQVSSLQKQLDEQETSSSSETSAITAEMARLETEQGNRQLVLDQIRASYEQVNTYLTISDYNNALNQLDSLESYLSRESTASLPYVQNRLAVDNFIIDSIRKLIKQEQSALNTDTASLLGAASELTSVSAAVEKADTYFRNGDTEAAKELYIAALNEIPSLQKSYSRLQEINDLSFQQREENLSKLIETGDLQFSAGNFEGSLNSYEKALEYLKEDFSGMGRLVTRISEAGYKLGSAEETASETFQAKTLLQEADRLYRAGNYSEAISAYAGVVQQFPNSSLTGSAMEGLQSSLGNLIKELERDISATEAEVAVLRQSPEQISGNDRRGIIQNIETIKDKYANYSDFSEGTGERSRDELYSLLQAKLLMKQILNSSDIRSQHPELYESVEKYYEAYGKDQWEEGRNATMRDIIAFIDILLRPAEYSDEEITQKAEDLRYRDELFTEFLGKLQTLIK